MAVKFHDRDRRTDRFTSTSIRDALRACGSHPAAQALAFQGVRLGIAVRVLAIPGKRRPTCAP
jgi:hypothetical protein